MAQPWQNVRRVPTVEVQGGGGEPLHGMPGRKRAEEVTQWPHKNSDFVRYLEYSASQPCLNLPAV